LTEQICLARADVIFTVSEELKDFVSWKVSGKNIVVKPNGVNAELFQPLDKGGEIRKKYGIKAEVVVGYAGSFASNHGMETLAKAIETISKKHEEIHFLLVGKGDRYPYIKEFVHQRELEDRVSLAGNIPHRQIPLYLDACDILIAVYTHADFDGSPMKVFEYMAMEKPVISTTQGQIPRIIDNGEDGLLIESGDKDSLVEAILLLANDKNLRLKMGKKARKKVLENYTWERTVEKMVDAYQQITA
jgi:glycosyltransferase involved in cell wall biosynthesis